MNNCFIVKPHQIACACTRTLCSCGLCASFAAHMRIAHSIIFHVTAHDSMRSKELVSCCFQQTQTNLYKLKSMRV